MHKSTMLICAMMFSTMLSASSNDDGSHLQPDNYSPRVKIETTMGDFVVELDRRRAPITTNNFLRYVDQGAYADSIFHRVIQGFVVQGGGYDQEFRDLSKFPDIYNESGNGMKNEKYTIAMARRNNAHSANRQFYINMNRNENLDPGRNWGYAVFGNVVEGEGVLDAISQVDTHYSVAVGKADVPVEPILIKKATLLPPQ